MGDAWWERCFALSLRLFMRDVGTELAKKRGLGSLQPPSFLRAPHTRPILFFLHLHLSTLSQIFCYVHPASKRHPALQMPTSHSALDLNGDRPTWQHLGCFLPETLFFFPSPHPPPGSATQRRVAFQAVLCTRPHEAPPNPTECTFCSRLFR